MRQTKSFKGIILTQLSALEAIKIRYGMLSAMKAVNMSKFQNKLKPGMTDQQIGDIFFDDFISLTINGQPILDVANNVMKQSGVPVDQIPESDFMPFLITCLKLSWPDFFAKLPAVKVGTELT